MCEVTLKFEFETQEDMDFFLQDLMDREDLIYSAYSIVSQINEEDEE